MQFHSHANQSHFHNNGFALKLTLKQGHENSEMAYFFSCGRKISFLCKIFSLFLPCNKAAVQNLYFEVVLTVRNEFQNDFKVSRTLDARGLLARQRWGASERVVFVGERPLAQAAKSFERADPITLPVISPESRFDPGNLIGRLEKRFLQGLLLVKCATILVKPV